MYLIDSDLVLENMIASKQLDEQHRDNVQEVLLSRHRHQHDKKSESKGLIRTLTDIGKKSSSKNIGMTLFVFIASTYMYCKMGEIIR